jgi:hypothetical protein
VNEVFCQYNQMMCDVSCRLAPSASQTDKKVTCRKLRWLQQSGQADGARAAAPDADKRGAVEHNPSPST